MGAANLVLTHFSARYEQPDKYKKQWLAARDRGVSVAELNAGTASDLIGEARNRSQGAKVYVANDFYTFTVQPRAPVSAAAAAAAAAKAAARRAAPQGAFAGSGQRGGRGPGRGRGGGMDRGAGRPGQYQGATSWAPARGPPPPGA